MKGRASVETRQGPQLDQVAPGRRVGKRRQRPAFIVSIKRPPDAALARATGLLALLLITAAFAIAMGFAPAFAQQGAANGAAAGNALAKVPMREPPMLTLQADPPYGYAPLQVGFVLTAVDPQEVGFVSYHWDLGDGHVSTLPPTLLDYTYTKAGTYVVKVTAVTADGRSASAFVGIVVKPPKAR